MMRWRDTGGEKGNKERPIKDEGYQILPKEAKSERWSADGGRKRKKRMRD